MRKLLSALVDVACGLPFVLIAFFGARVLLQSAHLVYLCFPLLAVVAFAVGFLRGSTRALPPVITAVVPNLPLLAVAIAFFSGRNKPFIAFPIVTFVFVCVGMAIARMRSRAWPAAIGLLTACLAGAWAGPLFVQLTVPSADVNERPAPFVIHLLNGSTMTSEALRGKIVVLDFWATWCVPCQRELPALQRVYEGMKHQSDVAFVAVDGVMTDVPGDPGDTPERASAYFRRGGYTIPLAWDGGGVLERSFALKGFPTLIVVDAEGRVRMRRVGYMGPEGLESALAGKVEALRQEAGHGIAAR